MLPRGLCFVWNSNSYFLSQSPKSKILALRSQALPIWHFSQYLRWFFSSLEMCSIKTKFSNIHIKKKCHKATYIQVIVFFTWKYKKVIICFPHLLLWTHSSYRSEIYNPSCQLDYIWKELKSRYEGHTCNQDYKAVSQHDLDTGGHRLLI